MRSIVFAALVAAGVGMLGTAGASAAPASGLTMTPDTNITQVQHWRWGSRHYRWGSRGWRNCHVRRWSRWARC
jgi:hypothetical protein